MNETGSPGSPSQQEATNLSPSIELDSTMMSYQDTPETISDLAGSSPDPGMATAAAAGDETCDIPDDTQAHPPPECDDVTDSPSQKVDDVILDESGGREIPGNGDDGREEPEENGGKPGGDQGKREEDDVVPRAQSDDVIVRLHVLRSHGDDDVILEDEIMVVTSSPSLLAIGESGEDEVAKMAAAAEEEEEVAMEMAETVEIVVPMPVSMETPGEAAEEEVVEGRRKGSRGFVTGDGFTSLSMLESPMAGDEGDAPLLLPGDSQLQELVERERETHRGRQARSNSISLRPTKVTATDTSIMRNTQGESPIECLQRIIDEEDLEELGQLLGHRHDYDFFFSSLSVSQPFSLPPEINRSLFSKAVLEAYVSMFDFRAMAIDVALRSFLSGFVLPVEAQQIDRIMEKFSQRFHEANPTVLSHPDTAYVLSFSLIMLNTDLHNQSVKNKMTKQDFVRNNRQIDQGKDLPRQYLEDLYDSIKREQFQYPSHRRGTRRSLEGRESRHSMASQRGSEGGSSLWLKLGSKFRTLSRNSVAGIPTSTSNLSLSSVASVSSTASSSSSTSAQNSSSSSRSGRSPPLSSGSGVPPSIKTPTPSQITSSTSSGNLTPHRRSNSTPTAIHVPTSPPSGLTLGSGSFRGSSRSGRESPTAVIPDPALLKQAAKDTADDYVLVTDPTAPGPSRLKKSPSAPGDLSLLAKSHRVAAKELGRVQAGRKIHLPLRRSASTSCLEVASTPFKQPIRQSVLYRKSDVDADGRKARGRNWKLTWVVVRGFSLFLYTGDISPQAQRVTPEQIRLEKVVSLREALCFQEDNYTKREFVFRLVTASSLSYLFQAGSLLQLSKWLHAINHQAAICTAVSLDKTLSSSTVNNFRLTLVLVPALTFFSFFFFLLWLSQYSKVQAVRKKLVSIQKRVEIEAAYKTGIDKLIEHYKGNKNRNMLTQTYHQFQKWEEQNQVLLEERRKYAVYVGLFEDMTPESFVGLRKTLLFGFFSTHRTFISCSSPLVISPVL